MKQPVGVILAGGLSSRMGGGDKSLLPLGGKPVVKHVIERLEQQVAALAINANSGTEGHDRFGLPVIADSVPGHPGPLAGILAGLDWAATLGADYVVSAAADTPFFPADLVPRLLLAAETDGKPIALAVTPDPKRGRARHPTFGLWPVALRDDLRAELENGMRRVVLWAQKHGTAYAEFPVGQFDPFFNINSPDDMETANTFIGAASA